MDAVKQFLLGNGFVEGAAAPFSLNFVHPSNKCIVEIRNLDIGRDEHYVVWTSEGSMYSKDLNIYWLVGILVWYDLIEQPIKK